MRIFRPLTHLIFSVLVIIAGGMLPSFAHAAVNETMSGSWYDPSRDGEGFLLEILDDQQAIVYWTSTTHINWTQNPGSAAVYISFGRSMGYIDNNWVDIHGAGAQRSDPKAGDPANYPTGRGPQGDAIRIYNHVRLVRDTQ